MCTPSLLGYIATTEPTTQNNLKKTFVGVVLLSVRKPTPTTTPHHGVIVFKAVLGNPGS